MRNQTWHKQTWVHGDRLWQFYRVKDIGEDGSWQLILDLWTEKKNIHTFLINKSWQQIIDEVNMKCCLINRHLFVFDLSYLNAVDLDAVGALTRWDAVLHLHPRQEVPPEGSTGRLQHSHVHAIGSKAHLEDNNKQQIGCISCFFPITEPPAGVTSSNPDIGLCL